MKAYFFSGLGADHRAFEMLKLPSRFEVIHVPWIPHFKDEPLKEYALRISSPIDCSEPFILAGLSFGGIVATEIAKVKKPVKLILLSTVAEKADLPALYRLAGGLKITKVLPASVIKSFPQATYWFFGATTARTKKLIDEFIRQSDADYLRWALHKIASWRNKSPFEPVLRIHGSLDRAFPLPKNSLIHVIKGGGHFCIHTHYEEVNTILSGLAVL